MRTIPMLAMTIIVLSLAAPSAMADGGRSSVRKRPSRARIRLPKARSATKTRPTKIRRNALSLKWSEAAEKRIPKSASDVKYLGQRVLRSLSEAKAGEIRDGKRVITTWETKRVDVTDARRAYDRAENGAGQHWDTPNNAKEVAAYSGRVKRAEKEFEAATGVSLKSARYDAETMTWHATKHIPTRRTVDRPVRGAKTATRIIDNAKKDVAYHNALAAALAKPSTLAALFVRAKKNMLGKTDTRVARDLKRLANKLGWSVKQKEMQMVAGKDRVLAKQFPDSLFE